MKFVSFQIRSFRSIVNSGRIEFSRDNITALVGQNESGKSAVLDALSLTFTSRQPSADDFRYNEELPSILVETLMENSESDILVGSIKDNRLRENAKSVISKLDGKLTWDFFSYLRESDSSVRMTYIIREINEKTPGLLYHDESLDEDALKESLERQGLELAKLRELMFDAAPTFVPFDEDTGLLPNRIDVLPDGTLKSGGVSAAQNFLKIAGIDLAKLINNETKAQTTLLKRANRKITDEFRAFWKQNIGQTSGIELSCAIHQYGAGKEKQGQSFLEFLISDGDNTLHPAQRSRGTRWFISFFLQLRASAEEGSDHFYLLDEPGSNLHERAQNDVLDLIEKISQKIGVMYSTHSPHLIRQDRLNRIVAVERDDAAMGHPTKLIGAHLLGAAHTDTLSPVFVAMGVSLARQTSIRSNNNVILEELSAQYYLKSFWLLTDCTQEVHFLAATGASNVPMLANLFLGWGLDFIVVLDDEGTGRGVFNRLKRDMFLDDGVWAKRRLYKIAGCDGIEDIFDPRDYQEITKNSDLKEGQKNSAWAKSNGAAKAIHALQFLHNVERGNVTLEILREGTQQRIRDLVGAIVDRLVKYQATPVV